MWCLCWYKHILRKRLYIKYHIRKGYCTLSKEKNLTVPNQVRRVGLYLYTINKKEKKTLIMFYYYDCNQ